MDRRRYCPERRERSVDLSFCPFSAYSAVTDALFPFLRPGPSVPTADASGKVKELVENILESFDTLPHPVPSDHFDRHPHFSRLSTTSTSERHPLLNATTLKKLTRLLTLVVRKSGGPAGLWWGSSLDEGDPERLMGLLRGSLEEAQAVGDVWGEEVRDEASPPKGKAKVGSKSPEKSAAAKGKGKAKADAPEEVKEEEGNVGEAAEPSVGVEGFEEMMEVALEAALATDCCLVLLSSKGVPAQVCPTPGNHRPAS